jgi:site-specific recombinase XerD
MPRKTFSLKITTPELLEKVNPENTKLVNRFLREKQIRSSEKTIVVYESNLNIFMVWNLLHNENKFFVDIKKLEFSDFFSYATETLKLGSARLNNLRSVLSSLSIFIERFFDVEYPQFRNVILKVIESIPKETRREKTVLSDKQVEDLLQYLSEKDKQRACWLALAVCSGARFSELLRIDVDMIDETNLAFGSLFIESGKKIKTKGRGKGKMIFKYILRDKFMPYYNAWIIEREKIMKENNQEHMSLFIKQDGSPITEAAVRHWIISFEEYLGVPFYTHCLRHYLTTLLSKKNIPADLIKNIFGWESIQMVELYSDLSAKDREWKELEGFTM